MGGARRSRVLCHYMLSYSNAAILRPDPNKTSLHHNIDYDSLFELRDALRAVASTDTLLIMNGSDHMSIQRGLPAIVNSLNRAMPDNVFLGSLTEFRKRVTASIRSDLEEVSGELVSGRYQPVLQGVLSTRMPLKQMNHNIETRLEHLAEPLSAVCWLTGEAYPGRWLSESWKWLLQNQPHDSICGCSTDEVHRHMMYRFSQAGAICDEVVTSALDKLATKVRVNGIRAESDIAIVVFNPLPKYRTGKVVIAIEPCIGYPIGVRTFTPEGYAEINLARYVATDAAGGHSALVVEDDAPAIKDVLNRRKMVPQKRVSLIVRDVQPLGYKTIVLEPADGDKVTASISSRLDEPLGIDKGRRTVSNELVEVTAREDGSLGVLHKETGHMFESLNYFEDEADAGDEYTFCPLGGQGRQGGLIRSTDTPSVEIRCIDRRPLEVGLHVSGSMRVPVCLTDDRRARSAEAVAMPFDIRVTLTRGSPRVDIVAQIDNTARDHRLRVVFDAAFSVRKFAAESAFFVSPRSTDSPSAQGWREAPVPTFNQKRFVALDHADGTHGLAVLNKGLPECEVTPDGEIKLTLLRCVGWLSRDDLANRNGHVGPPLETPEAQRPGRHTFEYAMLPYSGTWRSAEIWHAAADYTQPLMGVRQRNASGRLPREGSFLRLTGSGLVLSAFKKAAGNDALIVRIYNTLDRAVDGSLAFHERPKRVCLANLNEQAGKPLAVGADGSVAVQLKPCQIQTLEVRF